MKICFFTAVFLLIASVSLVSAPFGIGNYSIETEYGGGEFLKGWINISLQDEDADSLFSCFDQEISIFDFLDRNNIDCENGGVCSCFPGDCETYYEAEEGNSAKSFSLNKLETKIIGLKFQGELKDDPKISASFKIESNAGENCFQPLKIDVLNDGEIEWLFFSALDEFPCSFSTGCFNPSESISEPRISETPYCEKIHAPPHPNFEVGAYIINGSTPDPEFKMQVYNTDLEKLSECMLVVDSSGEKSCIVSLNLTKTEDIFVCVNAGKETDYKIKRENAEPCGFYGIDSEEFTADYYIFAKGSRYAPVGSFIFNEEEFEKYNIDLESYIETYFDRFENNCAKGCIVPIKFISGINQEITLSDLQLSYDTMAGLEYEDEFYDVKEEAAKITADFIKLNLEYANFSVPLTDGDYEARIYLNEKQVAEEEISVFASLNIIGLNSQEVPAAVPYKFVVYVSGGNITSYNWDFGDGITEETAKNEVIHKYSEIKDYNLKIEVTDSSGKKTIRNFVIRTTSPKKFIELSLETKRRNLDNTIENLESVTTWHNQELQKLTELDEIESELDRLEREYEIALAVDEPEEYIAVMSKLLEAEVPYSLQAHRSSGDFFLNAEYVNPSYLTDIGLREVENPEKYTNSIINWFNENIEIDVESKNYYLYYADKQVPVLTAFILKIKPKQDFGKESYLIIDKSYDEITFKENYNEKAAGSVTAITFSELSQGEEKIIEFILPEKIEIIELPAFISPEFSQLPRTGGIMKYIPPDLPWKKIITYLVILLLASFVVYIVLQEWYKRYYENRLFKNKNELFNLISFMNNALNQGLSRRSIIKKLKGYEWDGEQIVYGFKKIRGERTGMWEIPIFKFLEKRKVKKEIEKRKQISPPRQRGIY